MASYINICDLFYSQFFQSFVTAAFFAYLHLSIQVIDVGGKTLSRGTDRGMAYAKFKVHKFSYLNITNIGSDYVFKGSECGLVCVNIPSCFSFNLAAFSNIISGKILSVLLPSDIQNNSKKFVASQFHHHYSIRVSKNLTEKSKHSYRSCHLWYSAKSRVEGQEEFFLEQCIKI